LGFCEAVGIKAYGHERITTPIGRRGKPIKRFRLIPADKAFALACRFQGRFVQLPAPLSP
jgi:hypothetical protein